MRIAYVTNVRLPSERAHGHQIAQVCDAITRLGHEVTILAPHRKNPLQESYTKYYRADPSVKIQYLGDLDPIDHPYIFKIFQLPILNAFLRKHLRHHLNFDLFYTRAPALLSVLLGSKKPVILELHRLPRSGKRKFVKQCNQCALVVCLTSQMKQELMRMGVKSDHVIVEGDAFDPTLFTHAPHAEVAKKKWNLEADLPVIGYTGQLSSMGLNKGLPHLLQSLEALLKKGVLFQAVIAGGPDSEREKLAASLSPVLRAHVHFLGFVPHAEIASVLSACDVLVYPAPKSSDPYYQRDVSPLKLFEYMAAGKPIACADLPPLKDIVDRSTVRLYEPGNADACATAIQELIKNPAEAQKLAKAAHTKVQRYTWEERMKRVLIRIKNN